MVTHSRILAWKMPWTEELCGLQSLGSQRVRLTLLFKLLWGLAFTVLVVSGTTVTPHYWGKVFLKTLPSACTLWVFQGLSGGNSLHSVLWAQDTVPCPSLGWLSLVSDRVLTYMLSALLCTRRPPRSLGFSLWAALAPGFSVLSTPVAFVSLYFQRHLPNSESLSGSTSTLLPCAAAAWKLWRQWTWTLVGLTSFVFHLSRITVFHQWISSV